MSVRNVYPVKLLNTDRFGRVFYTQLMTVAFNRQGKWIDNEAEAKAIAEEALHDSAGFLVEQLFVVYEKDGSSYYLPDTGNMLTNPYLYPLEIAYGFVISRREAKYRRSKTAMASFNKPDDSRFTE